MVCDVRERVVKNMDIDRGTENTLLDTKLDNQAESTRMLGPI